MQKKDKIFVTVHKYGKNIKKLDKSSFKSFLEISKTNPIRIDLLTQFLNLKTYQNFDRINMMSIPELRKLHSNYVKILKYNTNPSLPVSNSSKYGLDHCDLVKMAEFSNVVSICPWHWSNIERQERFPFKRYVAICNCKHCQANTIFDKDIQKVSLCKPEFSISPVLLRESINGELERWNFYLEEIPTSCVCTIKLNPHK